MFNQKETTKTCRINNRQAVQCIFPPVSAMLDLPASPSFADDWEIVPSESDGSLSVAETADGPWPPRVWWASLLMKHARALGLMVPAIERPVTCISACTGSFAEGFVLEAGSN